MTNLLGRSPDHGFDEPLGLLSDCHRRIERFLDVLLRVTREHARDAEPAPPLDPTAADAVRAAMTYFAQAAPRHTADEEESLFPRMRQAAASQAVSCDPLDRLEDDHEAARSLHARADAILSRWLNERSLPAEGPGSVPELRTLLAQLRELYRAHIRAEDDEIFPLAARLLSPADLEDIGAEMRARRGLPRAEQSP